MPASRPKNGYKSMFRIMPAIRLFIYACLKFSVISGQFPNHLDLQKIDEVVVNNQKYSVLKPTVHLVTDYFEQFIQKRHNTNSPNERIFIDENGFRHHWTGMNIPTAKSSRKTDKSNTKHNDTNKQTNIVANNETNISNETKTDEKKEINFGNIGTEKQSTTIRPTPKRKKKRVINENFKPVLRQGAVAGSVVKTSFFCPFLGVITMTLNTEEL